MSLSSARCIKRIAIIGAGPGGVAAAKGISSELSAASIDIFEQQASFGGVWNYSIDAGGVIDVPQINPDQPLEKPLWQSNDINGSSKKETAHSSFPSPMYERLETNIPHFIMKHSDAPSLEHHQLFPSREVVTDYLEKYAEDVKRFVHFETQVIDVRRRSETAECRWAIKAKKLWSGEVLENDYDTVVVANGHYAVPMLPDIKGIREWDQTNKGVISHSKAYRKPEPFANKKVIVVGNSASGLDIASQIATMCRQPLLKSTRADSPLAHETEHEQSVPEIVEFLPPTNGTRAIRFSNNRVEEDIDAIVFCTGYYYSFPFLSSITPKLISNGDRVQHLYKHLFYIPDPTLAFIGLPSKIVPFRTFEGQSAVVARVWSRRLNLPSESEMAEWEKNLVKERGSGRRFHVLQFPKDFEYHNEMVAWATSAQGNFQGIPPEWTEEERWFRERFPAIKAAFADKGEARHTIRTAEELGYNYDSWLNRQGWE